jgi:hypothetical protein
MLTSHKPSSQRNESVRSNDCDSRPSEQVRREIFLALVDAQDHYLSVAQSRKAISDRYGITEIRLRNIEEEGLEQQWPPLRETTLPQKPRFGNRKFGLASPTSQRTL